MKINNLEELLQEIEPNIAVFDDSGEVTFEAADAYDKIVNVLTYLQEQGVVENKNVIDKLDKWSNDVIRNEI